MSTLTRPIVRTSSGSVIEAPEVGDAVTHVGERTVAVGRAGQHGVLLQDVPALVAPALEQPDDLGHVDVAAAQRPVHAGGHGVGVADVAVADLGGPAGVDVL